jgi:phospholipase/carboxylesterase
MLQSIEVQTGENPQASVIVLHGLGADGRDFLPVAQALDLRSAGDVRYVLPHAPIRPVTLNNGYPMRAWYDIVALGGRAAEDEAGLRESQRAVDELVERERNRGVAPGRIILMGFSQGCAVALMAGLRHRERLAGIAGLSGYLPLASTLPAELAPANADLPVFLAHGRDDPTIALARGLQTRDALARLRLPVEWHEYEMGHEVCNAELADLQRWLLRSLARDH